MNQKLVLDSFETLQQRNYVNGHSNASLERYATIHNCVWQASFEISFIKNVVWLDSALGFGTELFNEFRVLWLLHTTEISDGAGWNTYDLI